MTLFYFTLDELSSAKTIIFEELGKKLIQVRNQAQPPLIIDSAQIEDSIKTEVVSFLESASLTGENNDFELEKVKSGCNKGFMQLKSILNGIKGLEGKDKDEITKREFLHFLETDSVAGDEQAERESTGGRRKRRKKSKRRRRSCRAKSRRRSTLF